MKRILLLSLISLIGTTNITMEPPIDEPQPETTKPFTLKSTKEKIINAIAQAQIRDKKDARLLAFKTKLFNDLLTKELNNLYGTNIEKTNPEIENAKKLIMQTKWALEGLKVFEKTDAQQFEDQNNEPWIIFAYPDKAQLSDLQQLEKSATGANTGKLGQEVLKYLKGAKDILEKANFDSEEAKLYQPKASTNIRNFVPFDAKPIRTLLGAVVPSIVSRVWTNYNLTSEYLNLANRANNIKSLDEAIKLKDEFVATFSNRLNAITQKASYEKWTGGTNDRNYLGNLLDDFIMVIKNQTDKIPATPTDLNKNIIALCTDLKELHAQAPAQTI